MKNWRKYPRETAIIVFMVMWLRETRISNRESARADRAESRAAALSETYRRQDSAKYERIMDMAAQNAYNKIFKPKIDSLKNL